MSCCGASICKDCDETCVACPSCLTPCPTSDEEIVRMLERHVEEHEDLVWPLANLGKCYEFGKGCVRDPARAVHLFQKGADRGCRTSQYVLARFYMEGAHGLPLSEEKAIEWYEKAASAGCALSHYCLAILCRRRREYETAVLHCTKAAEDGYPQAQSKLGYCYRDGIGMDQPSMKKAVHWFRKASHSGDVEGMVGCAMGLLTEESNRTNIDMDDRHLLRSFPESFFWARRAIVLTAAKDDQNFSRDDMTLAMYVVQGYAGTSGQCIRCRKEASSDEKYLKCSRCKAVHYCSRNCQKSHWKTHHKFDCVDDKGMKISRGTGTGANG